MRRPNSVCVTKRTAAKSYRFTITSNVEEPSSKKPSIETPSSAADDVSEKQAQPAKSESANAEYQVPGKIQLTPEELAEQKAALDKYTLELRKRQIEIDREAARIFGWVPYSETLNGRLAMFFLTVGVLTEYWTGYTMPQQVELMLRTLGFF